MAVFGSLPLEFRPKAQESQGPLLCTARSVCNVWMLHPQSPRPQGFACAAFAACAAVVVVASGGCPQQPAALPPAVAVPHALPAPVVNAGVAFVHDDVAGAFATAKATGKVVFVDGWAPWCHTCLSMQRDVLQDPALGGFADRVVFAAVDTDRPESSSFVARFPLRVWPSFFVIDPVTEQVLALHGGSLSLPELRAFLDEALLTRDPKRASDPQVKAVLAGHQASNSKDYAAAAAFYVAAAALDGPRRDEAIIGAMRSLSAAHDDDGCLSFGLASLRSLRTSSSSSDLVGYVQSCAEHLAEHDPRKAVAYTAARARLDELVHTPPAGASVDDRADTLAMLADIALAQADPAAHHAAHVKRLALLEDDANRQSNVDDARVHDYARMNSYFALERGAEAVTLLGLRSVQLPTSYEAWARLASALHKLQREDEAKTAVIKAIELSYGPRRLRYRTLLADIEAARPRSAESAAAEKQAVKNLIDDADKMPPGQRDAEVVAAAHKRFAALP